MVEWSYKSPLVFLNGHRKRGGMSKEDYIKQVLEPVVSPYFRDEAYVSPYNLIVKEYGSILFQEDGNSAHGIANNAENLHELKEKLGIELFNNGHWLPCSPDLSIIENIWRIIKGRIGNYEQLITKKELKAAVQEEWNRIEQ